MNTVTLTHTTYNTPVEIWVDQVIAVFVAPTMKSTVVVGPGSTAIPVLGTVEEVKSKINAAKAAQPKEA